MEKNPQIPEKIIVIPTERNEEFYLDYLRFTKYNHKLTEGQMKVLASFLYHRYVLSKDISNPEILDQVTLGKDIRKTIRESFNMTPTHFQVIMSKFKERGVIVDGRINPKVIPVISEDTRAFKLLVYFKFDEKQD